MPYIKKEKRKPLLLGTTPTNAGELNFIITTKLLDYVKNKGESYQTYNDIIGVLGAISHEFYRRQIVGYEDDKVEENGDVFI